MHLSLEAVPAADAMPAVDWERRGWFGKARCLPFTHPTPLFSISLKYFQQFFAMSNPPTRHISRSTARLRTAFGLKKPKLNKITRSAASEAVDIGLEVVGVGAKVASQVAEACGIPYVKLAFELTSSVIALAKVCYQILFSRIVGAQLVLKLDGSNQQERLRISR